MRIEEYTLESMDSETWDNLLDRSGSLSPFCRSAWLRLIAGAFPRWRVSLVLLIDQGRIAGGFPSVDRRDLFTRQSHSLPWGTPAGLVLEDPGDHYAADRLVDYWAGRHAGSHLPWRIAMTFPEPRPAGLSGFERRGFRPLLQRALLVQVAGRGMDEWEASLSDSVRNQNRQAVRRGSVFTRIDSPDHVPDIMRLAALTAHRHHRPGPLLGEGFYRLLLDPKGPVSGDDALARVYMVRVDGKPAAYSVCLLHGRRLWLWDYGADHSLFQSRPNNHMYHRVIMTAFKEGLDSVELGVAPEGADSLAAFKRGFGAAPYERLSVVYSSPLFRAGISLRQSVFRRKRGL